MNRSEVIAFLATLFPDFVVHDSFIAELSALIANSGIEKKFFNLLLVRLKFLSERGPNAISLKEFELLKDASNIYSMHLSGSGFNIRILYSFLPDSRAILLNAFYKRSGKRKTDYSQQIPIAVQRLSDYHGGKLK